MINDVVGEVNEDESSEMSPTRPRAGRLIDDKGSASPQQRSSPPDANDNAPDKSFWISAPNFRSDNMYKSKTYFKF